MEQNEAPEEIKTDETPPAHQIGLGDGFIREVQELIDQDYIDRIHELCQDMPAADAAELLGKTEPERRRKLVSILEDTLPAETFAYLDYGVLKDVLGHMPGDHIAAIVNELESDDAIGLIDGLPEERQSEILRHLSRRMRAAIEEGLTFPEESAGRLMQREYVAIPRFWTVGKAVDYLRAAAEALPDTFYDIFIVDPTHKFIGAVALSRMLCTQRTVKMDVLVNEQHISVPAEMDQEQVALLFRRKGLLSAPVVDKEGRLIGVITIDDIVDVIDQEAEEDFLKLGGVADTDIYRSTLSTARSRFIWLAVNLITAILAAAVIGFFEGTVQKFVALAVLMPIVASMGGNAGTQTLAVAVRAIATNQLSSANAWRVIGKEFMVGSINGFVFAVLMGGATWLWYEDLRLGTIMAAAMIVNLMAAGLSGIVIPIAIARAGLDPATSATVFLTTVTDVVGFFAFLGLATWLLL